MDTHKDILPFSVSLLPREKTKNNPDAIRRRMVNSDAVYRKKKKPKEQILKMNEGQQDGSDGGTCCQA